MGSQHRWPCWLFWQPAISILLVVIKFCSVLFWWSVLLSCSASEVRLWGSFQLVVCDTNRASHRRQVTCHKVRVNVNLSNWRATSRVAPSPHPGCVAWRLHFLWVVSAMNKIHNECVMPRFVLLAKLCINYYSLWTKRCSRKSFCQIQCRVNDCGPCARFLWRPIAVHVFHKNGF